MLEENLGEDDLLMIIIHDCVCMWVYVCIYILLKNIVDEISDELC